MDQLRRRLEETEKAMERICRQMGDVTDKLSTCAVAELLAPHLLADKVRIGRREFFDHFDMTPLFRNIVTRKKERTKFNYDRI